MKKIAPALLALATLISVAGQAAAPTNPSEPKSASDAKQYYDQQDRQGSNAVMTRVSEMRAWRRASCFVVPHETRELGPRPRSRGSSC